MLEQGLIADLEAALGTSERSMAMRCRRRGERRKRGTRVGVRQLRAQRWLVSNRLQKIRSANLMELCLKNAETASGGSAASEKCGLSLSNDDEICLSAASPKY